MRRVPFTLIAATIVLGATGIWFGQTSALAATSVGDRLTANGTLTAGHELLSPSHAYRAVMQSDGNFVVYQGSTARWSSGTGGTGANRVVMQSDGNVVVYGTTAKWSSNTAGTGASRLVMQDDGNLVAYTGHGRAAWSSKGGYIGDRLKTNYTLYAGDGQLESPNHAYRAVMQGDGNFVVYQGSTARWSSGTSGSGANRVAMQSDGNVVVYGTTAKWSSNTAATGASRIAMQDDGNLVVYTGQNRAVWTSREGYIGDRLKGNYTLYAGDGQLESPNHAYRAVMQGDGNFVVYQGSTARWASGTAGTGANRVVMQSDNNVVVYGSTAKWSSNTASTGASRLVMQDDGNLVAYTGQGRAVWSSKGGYIGDRLKTNYTLYAGDGQLESPNHAFRAVMQGDGNFVVYQGSTAQWSSGTAGSGANRVVMQADGNAVVYNGSSAKWSSGTAGSGADRIVMQDDGNLVVYAGSKVVWASKTAGGSARGQQAANWAISKIGSKNYDGLCLTFVRNAWLFAGLDIASQTSNAWNDSTYPDDVWGHFTQGTTGTATQTPPIGALVFIAAYNGDRTLSHVEIYVGNNTMVGSDDSMGANVHTEAYAGRARVRGWWMPNG